MMRNKNWMMTKLKVGVPEFDKISHEVMNFIDDLNTLISFSNPQEENTKLDIYFKFLENYYNLNKLKLNHEKSNLLVISKPKAKKAAINIILNTEDEDEDVKPKNQILVLGWEFNERLSNDTNIRRNKNSTRAALACGEEFKIYMTEETRLKFINSYLKSKQDYGVEFFIGETQNNRNKYHAIPMLLARWVKNSHCYKISCYKILTSLKWETPQQ